MVTIMTSGPLGQSRASPAAFARIARPVPDREGTSRFCAASTEDRFLLQAELVAFRIGQHDPASR